MFLTRKIGSFLRGKATRGQVFVAALLAGLLGFVPGFFLPEDLGGGFLQAPGLMLALLFLVLVLNANLGVFSLVTLLAKLTSMATLPIAFEIGRVLIDGPLQPLFRLLVNAPVSAWFGFDHYATVGGLVLGVFFGTFAGMLFVRALVAFRRRMANVEQSSERYQQQHGKVWVRFLTWVLFGKGKGKKLSWQELADSEQRGRAIRLVGVVLVVGIGAGLWVFQSRYSTPLLTDGLTQSLTAANGATVDVGKVELDLAGGSLRITDLAIADSSQLDQNVFAAADLEASIDTVALLRRRLVIGTLRVANATSGTPRATPGVLTPRPPEPPPEPAPAGTKTLDDYLADVEVWKQRLAQARDLLEQIGGFGDTAPSSVPPEEQRSRAEQQVADVGLSKARAEHLWEDLPLIVIRHVEIGGLDARQLGQRLDIDLKNFSSNAALLAERPTLSVKSADGALAFSFAGPSSERKGGDVALSLTGLAVDSFFARLKTGGSAPVRGGTFDISTSGSVQTHPDSETTMELPLQVTLHDTTFALPGSAPTKVERLLLPIGVRGVVTSPSIALDDKVLADALVQAGKQELANFVQGQAGQLLGRIPGAEGLVDPTKAPAQVVDDAKQAAEDAAKKAAEDAARKAAEEAAKKGLGGLKGLLPGKKN